MNPYAIGDRIFWQDGKDPISYEEAVCIAQELISLKKSMQSKTVGVLPPFGEVITANADCPDCDFQAKPGHTALHKCPNLKGKVFYNE